MTYRPTNNFIIFITILLMLLVGLLTGCSISQEYTYQGADGNEYKMVNSSIVMPFSPTSTHVQVMQSESKEMIIDELLYENGWLPPTGAALGSAGLIGSGLEGSGASINNSSSSLSDSISNSGAEMLYTPMNNSYKKNRY